MDSPILGLLSIILYKYMNTNKRYCLALDLKNDPVLIAEYETYHQAVWPEILQSIRESGIELLEIYRLGNRLFMIMEVNDDFSFDKKSIADAANPTVQKWETLMWQYQQALPSAKPGEKWLLMNKIFDLNNQPL
ncbi:L-rhamnose mutarotase [Paraflavitalea devenefica]|jgi:L-rhamnose mutarotase|uniref:L-rhamnose mutarotase n=1 Tax=Paraflavitalea devenefica TaxID=2716334 RepID=UPI001FEC80E3|nr:L-rhamnose mutarotase [Paraflavitalea devenefica]